MLLAALLLVACNGSAASTPSGNSENGGSSAGSMPAGGSTQLTDAEKEGKVFFPIIPLSNGEWDASVRYFSWKKQPEGYYGLREEPTPVDTLGIRKQNDGIAYWVEQDYRYDGLYFSSTIDNSTFSSAINCSVLPAESALLVVALTVPMQASGIGIYADVWDENESYYYYDAYINHGYKYLQPRPEGFADEVKNHYPQPGDTVYLVTPENLENYTIYVSFDTFGSTWEEDERHSFEYNVKNSSDLLGMTSIADITTKWDGTSSTEVKIPIEVTRWEDFPKTDVVSALHNLTAEEKVAAEAPFEPVLELFVTHLKTNGYTALLAIVQEGKFDAMMRYAYSNDFSLYLGEKNAEGQAHGTGTGVYMYDPYGGHMVYQGEWKNGLPHGEGTALCPYEDAYTMFTGTWENGAVNGWGTFMAKPTLYGSESRQEVAYYNTFEGNFPNGKAEGDILATYMIATSDKYVGDTREEHMLFTDGICIGAAEGEYISTTELSWRQFWTYYTNTDPT